MRATARYSIIVPVYNTKAYLENCVQSVMMQSYKEYELILVDDGSTDGSAEICDYLRNKDDRIIVIHQSNLGAAVARNAGIKAARGDYLIFIDSDDWWKENDTLLKIEKQISMHPSEVLSFNLIKYYSNEKSDVFFKKSKEMPMELSTDESFDYVVSNNLWISSPCNKVIKRQLVLDNNIFFREGVTAEDIDWNLRLALCAKRFDYLANVYYVYRQRENSVSSSMSLEKVRCLFQNVLLCRKILEETNNERTEKLKPFVAFQYATVLQCLASLSHSEETDLLYREVEEYAYLLSFGTHRKVKILILAIKIFGYKNTLRLLRLRQILR